MVDSIFRTRSLGVAAEGIPDQYADGKAAKVWEYYIGCKQSRTELYRKWLVNILREKGCQAILDTACGTGVDSIMLVEEGFNVVSTDASDKMLKYALKERWNRRKEQGFENWVIEEANWLSLVDDMEDIAGVPTKGFDAVLCLGNSFAHLQDFDGNQEVHKLALENFKGMVKPGGIMLIDHRNYDDILAIGTVPQKNVYYNSDHVVDIKCSNLYVNGRPTMVTLDYLMDMSIISDKQPETKKKMKFDSDNCHQHFRLSYYPHCLNDFTKLLKEVFGEECRYSIFADFKALKEVNNPAYYIHMVEMPKK